MRGQVTIFIVLLLVILFGFGFLFYVITQTSQTEGKANANELLEELRTSTRIEQGMRSCLNEAVKEGVTLLGQQGGYLYAQQTAQTPYGTVQVNNGSGLPEAGNTAVAQTIQHTIWVKAPTLQTPTGNDNDYENTFTHVPFTSPLYPCTSVAKGFPGVQFRPEKDVQFSGSEEDDCRKQVTLDTNVQSLAVPVWKEYPFPKVCKQTIPEVCGAAGGQPCQCLCDASNPAATCESSMQAMLERFVTAHFRSCFSSLEYEGYDLSLTGIEATSLFGTSTIDVILTPEVTVNSVVPSVTLTFPSLEAETVKIKLTPLLNILQALFEQGTRNELRTPNFHFKEEFENHYLFDMFTAPVSIETTSFQQNNKQYHLTHIQLQDEDGSIDGQPFRFSFVRENRIPVLAPIHDESSSGSVQKTVCAVDPDEEGIRYAAYFRGGTHDFTPLLNGCIETTFSQDGTFRVEARDLWASQHPTDTSLADWDEASIDVT